MQAIRIRESCKHTDLLTAPGPSADAARALLLCSTIQASGGCEKAICSRGRYMHTDAHTALGTCSDVVIAFLSVHRVTVFVVQDAFHNALTVRSN